jgi:hypothetical protein
MLDVLISANSDIVNIESTNKLLANIIYHKESADAEIRGLSFIYSSASYLL